MKTNPNNRSGFRSNRNARTRNQASSNLKRSTASSIKSRTTKDLRQILTKNKKPINKSNKPTISSNDVKSRLGLQSRTARIEAKKEAEAQLKLAQHKAKPQPKDVKNVSSIQTKRQTGSTKSRPDQRNQSRNQITSASTRQESFRNSRRPLDRSSKSDWRNEREIAKSLAPQPIIIPQYIPQQPIIYQQSSSNSYDNGTKFIRRSPVGIPEVASTVGNSILVSNLSPKITEDEVAELFGDIGPLMDVRIINSTTFLVTYFASQHAAKAVKVYNYRLLDGIAMNCCIVPATNPVQSSSMQPLYSSRMYSDSIPAVSSRSRSYNFGLH